MEPPFASPTRTAALSLSLFVLCILIPASLAWPWSASDRQPAPEDAAGPLTLELASHRAGDVPAHRVTVQVNAGDPEIYHAVLDYPEGFRFRGFEPAAGQRAVGAFELDVDLDGRPERSAPLVARGRRSAFADVIGDGEFSPGVEPDLRVTGESTLELRLPFGGDANSATLSAPLAARLSFVLFEGALQNPALGGRQVIDVRLTSVDPDSDGADDGFGGAPTSRAFTLPIGIDGPRLTVFSKLAIRDFDVHLRGRQADRFQLEGQFVLGRRSDGIDPDSEPITVVVGSFRQTIPGKALEATGRGYRYRGRAPGIVALTLGKDGRFAVEGRRLHWDDDRHRHVRVGLQIGNDVGETVASDGNYHQFR